MTALQPTPAAGSYHNRSSIPPASRCHSNSSVSCTSKSCPGAAVTCHRRAACHVTRCSSSLGRWYKEKGACARKIWHNPNAQVTSSFASAPTRTHCAGAAADRCNLPRKRQRHWRRQFFNNFVCVGSSPRWFVLRGGNGCRDARGKATEDTSTPAHPPPILLAHHQRM